MRMLLIICGKRLRDGISNPTIYDITGMEKIEELVCERAEIKMVRALESMNDERTPPKAKSFVVEGSKKGRPKE